METDPRVTRFSSEAEYFRTEGHALIDALASYLASMSSESEPAIHATDPTTVVAPFRRLLEGTKRPRDVLDHILPFVTNTQSPRFMGHQVSAPAVEAALATCISALINNSGGVFEMGPWVAAIERVVLEWALRHVGFAEGDGIVTSGGSVGNLTALLAARQRRGGVDAWKEGTEGRRLSIMTASESHYSVGRAARIMGLGDAGVVAVPVDARFRLDASKLEASLEDARRRGRHVFALVVSAASTSTGAYDPIEPAADFAEKHGLWLHVDGAHGASALLSPAYAPLVRGIHRADSVVWDAHKMLRVPSLATFVLYRERSASFAPFAQDASYLFNADQKAPPWHDGALRTLECTKPALGLPLFLLLASRGESYLAENVKKTFDLGRALAELVEAAPDFDLAVAPEINIVCFRHRPHGIANDKLSELQRTIRKRTLARGHYYIVQTTIAGEVWLRTSLMNPETERRDLVALLDEIRAVAAEVR